ncbi:MAG: hypothetical protein Tsb0021_03940 [Chlamydiales bacterium]
MKYQYNAEVVGKFHVHNHQFLDILKRSRPNIAEIFLSYSSLVMDKLKGDQDVIVILQEFFDKLNLNSNEELYDIILDLMRIFERQLIILEAVEDNYLEFRYSRCGPGTWEALTQRIRDDHHTMKAKRQASNYSMGVIIQKDFGKGYDPYIYHIRKQLSHYIYNYSLENCEKILLQLEKTHFRDETASYEKINEIILPTLSRLQVDMYELFQKELLDQLSISSHIKVYFFDPDSPLELCDANRNFILRWYLEELKKLRYMLSFKDLENSFSTIHDSLISTLLKEKRGIIEVHPYDSPLELLKDLMSLREKVIKDHDGIYSKELDAIIVAVKTFGFHLASVDFIYSEEKLELAHEIQKKHGLEAARYLFLEDPINAAYVEGVVSSARHFHVVPYFKDWSSVEQSPELITELLSSNVYQNHIKSKQNHQAIAYDFTSIAERNGVLPTIWLMFETEEKLSSIAKREGIKISIFRGFGAFCASSVQKVREFLLASSGHYSIETFLIGLNDASYLQLFRTERSSAFNLKSLFSSGFEQQIYNVGKVQLTEQERSLITTLMKHIRKSYLELDLENIKQKLYACNLIETLPFFGLGKALKLSIEQGSLPDLESLYNHSYFFRYLVKVASLSLHHPFCNICGPICNDERIKKEYALTQSMLEQVILDFTEESDSDLENRCMQFYTKTFLPAYALGLFAHNLKAEKRGNQAELEIILSKFKTFHTHLTKNLL